MGTGHAVLAAKDALADFDGDVVVTYADCPLLDAPAIEPLLKLREAGADIGVLGFRAADPAAYGRLIVDADDTLQEIVEAKEATPDQLKVDACNSGVLAASAKILFQLLAKVTNTNAKGEYYLTDVPAIGRAQGLVTKVAWGGETDVLGVNAQAELAEAERIFQDAVRRRLMAEGVSMVAPETVFFAWDTQVAAGVRIEPNVVFGPGVSVRSGAEIKSFSHIEGAVVGEGALIGPFARLRPGADIGPDAHIGNFVEVKNVVIGKGAKANHLTYLGDGEVGAGANIGAGVIFCNYDGFFKHRTVVGEGAFIGSNCALVAPVTIGAGAYTGSGAVITKDVAPGALALERSPQVEKPGWGTRFREVMKARKAAK